jgi:hypothetical protein
MVVMRGGRARYELVTPAGAWLEIHRGPRWTRIVIDRWPIANASKQQQEAAQGFASECTERCFERGYRGGIDTGAGKTIWNATVPTEELDAALRRLLVIEEIGGPPDRSPEEEDAAWNVAIYQEWHV